ncbi:MAG: LPS export ABC transporter ATP-binding protein [bacterium]
MLEARGLVKKYKGRTTVKGVSFHLSRGEVVGLLGPNGAGKTTTFRMIIGLIRSEGGHIYLNGTEITHLAMYRRANLGISYLAQESSIFRKLNVEQNIMAILETLDLDSAERQRQLEMLLAELNLTDLAKYEADVLSGGERRRVEITRALVTSPSFILLDEPFVGIDPKAVVGIQNIINKLKKKGIGVLITDHNVRETLTITDRAYIMYDGEILISGTTADLIKDARVKDLYLGESFRM